MSTSGGAFHARFSLRCTSNVIEVVWLETLQWLRSVSVVAEVGELHTGTEMEVWR